MNSLIQYNGKYYDARHGGAFDRGSADSWYGRVFNPHKYVGASIMTDLIPSDALTEEEVQAYKAGWDYNEEFGGKKDWGDE
jgi:hypothetical protein